MKIYIINIVNYGDILNGILDEKILKNKVYVYKDKEKAKRFYNKIIKTIKNDKYIQERLNDFYIGKEIKENIFAMWFCEQDDYEWSFEIELKETILK